MPTRPPFRCGNRVDAAVTNPHVQRVRAAPSGLAMDASLLAAFNWLRLLKGAAKWCPIR